MTMNDVNEEIVRLRAYLIWEREGRPEGREAAHWHAALRELEVEVITTNGAIENGGGEKPKAKPTAPRKSRIGSIAAKAKDALDGTPTAAKPPEPKRKRAPKSDKDSSKRSPRTP